MESDTDGAHGGAVWFLLAILLLLAYVASGWYLCWTRSSLLITDEWKNGQETLVVHPLGWFYFPVIVVWSIVARLLGA